MRWPTPSCKTQYRLAVEALGRNLGNCSIQDDHALDKHQNCHCKALDSVFRGVPMHFSAEVYQQERVLALSLVPLFNDFHIRINSEAVEQISLEARLEDGSFDQEF